MRGEKLDSEALEKEVAGAYSLRGSEWHRWDPHLHAPGTLLNDQFQGDWEQYLSRVEHASPVIEALGVTDYFSIGTYKEVRRRKADGRLRQVSLVFPNVEMRLDIKTEKKRPINIHLLFSPDDPDHESQIERILSHLSFEYQGRSYKCTNPDLIDLGLKFGNSDQQAALHTGAHQFKVTLSDIRNLFRQEGWLRQNCLVAVAGSSSDGTAGLQSDDSYAATREEIERFADIVLASTPRQRDFWLGKAANYDRDYIERTYGGLKPCLHGSDAHAEDKVGLPTLERLCWLKGDLCFETLRQAVIEPEDRVWVGPTSPSHAMPSAAITVLHTSDTPWLANASVELNGGLVAVIGAKGSGKTALAEMIAAGAHAPGAGQGSSSFLTRASRPIDYLENARARLTWADGSTTETDLHPATNDGSCQPLAKYLSQHFVERLCSAEGLATELRAEMERVVFEAIDPTERLQTDCFGDLLDVHLQPIRARRKELQGNIQSFSDEILKEDLLKAKLPTIRAECDALRKQADQGRRDLSKLLPRGIQERAKHLSTLEAACRVVQAGIEVLRRRKRSLEDLAAEAQHLRISREPTRWGEMRRRFTDAGLTDSEWTAFKMTFQGDAESVLASARARADAEIKALAEGEKAYPIDRKNAPLEKWPLDLLVSERNAVKKEVGLDAEKQKIYDNLQRTLSQLESAIKRHETLISTADGADERRTKLIDSRRTAYWQVFETLVEEEKVLRALYDPLGEALAAAEESLRRLSFAVKRDVNLKGWAAEGEAFLDLRKDTRFRGQGALEQWAGEFLADAWTRGTAEDVAKAMDAFRAEFTKDLLAATPASLDPEGRKAWNQSLAAWLYSTSHISITYGVEYEGVAIEQLSPGTRGVVLLLLYLAVDRRDTGPLIIDQPEENLDPRSVFEELMRFS